MESPAKRVEAARVALGHASDVAWKVRARLRDARNAAEKKATLAELMEANEAMQVAAVAYHEALTEYEAWLESQKPPTA